MRLGDPDKAEKLLASVPGSVASWESLDAAMKSGNYARAESLLSARAVAGDLRPDVAAHVRTLWGADAHDAAVHIVDLYGTSGAGTADRVNLRFMISDLAALAGDTALARRQALDAQRLGLSAAVDADARARLLALRLREFDQLAEVDALVARDSARAKGSPILKRLKDNLTLVTILLGNPDAAGAHVFLAAEIVRDSLHAYRLAHAMFRSIEREYPDYEIAARALLAAARMFPESTAAYHARILQRWDSSSAAFALKGLDPLRSKKVQEDGALNKAWRFAMNVWADTLKARKTADSLALINAARRQ
jgi:hypothetical protein